LLLVNLLTNTLLLIVLLLHVLVIILSLVIFNFLIKRSSLIEYNVIDSLILSVTTLLVKSIGLYVCFINFDNDIKNFTGKKKY